MVRPEHPIISKLEALLETINDTENKLKELKFQLRYIPKYFSEYSLTQEERLEIAQYLYWLDVKIPKDEIAFNLLGITGVEFSKILNASFSDIKCKVCLEPIIFKSKTAYKEFLDNYKKNYGGECKICLERRLEISRMERNKQIKERQTQYHITLNKLKVLPYHEYLQTPHWIKLRDEHLKRSKYRCQICNKSGKLNVHHRTYERKGEEDYNDLVTLCEDCHILFHNQGKIISY
jgi:5-methylcytosine-specific restriction endonuclease McrA